MNSQSAFAHQLPYNREIERAVLGSLFESSTLRVVMEKLGTRLDIFYAPAHKHIYCAALELFRTGLEIDPATVVYQLQKLGKLKAVGGPDGVGKLLNHSHAGMRVDTHCLLLLELYIRRQLIAAMQRALQHAYYEPADVLELVAELQRTIHELNTALQIKRPQYVHELLSSVLTGIAKATDNPTRGVTGVPSGLRALDEVTGGWQPSDLIIVAARPGMGKTSFLVSIGMHAALAGKPGAIFTLEVSSNQLVLKMVAKEAGYTTSQLRRGLLEGGIDEAYAISEKVEALRTMGVILDDTPSLSIAALRAKATQLKAEENIEWLAVDFLQLMTGDHKAGNREQEISSISRGLKMLAKELNIPIIALSQLSREVEKRGGTKRPQLSDLRESGAIEQDADLIVFPYRPEYYGITQDEQGNSTENLTELIVAKHRNGSTADVVVRSIMKYGRYENL